MLKNISIYLIGIIFFCTSSCTNDVTSKERNNTKSKIFEINVEEATKSYFHFEDMIDSVEVIPISNDEIIGRIDEMICIGDSLFLVTDTKYTKSILILSRSGKILHTYKYFGKGPRQAQYLKDIYFDNKNNNILVLFSNPNKIAMLDLQLNYISEKNTKYLHRICSDSLCYFYINDYLEMYIASDWEDELKEHKKFKLKDYGGFYGSPVFYKSQNNLYFNIPHDSIVYALKNGKLEKKLKMSYPRIPDNQVVDESKPLAKKYPPVITNIIELQETLLVEYTYNWMVKVAILSKSTGKIIHHGTIISQTFIKGNIMTGKDNSIYGIMDTDRFISREEFIKVNSIKKVPPKIFSKQNLDSLKEDNNPLILKYYVKKVY